jgi:hypothetical protein
MPKLKTFSKLPSGDRVLDQVQDAIATVLNPIASSPINNATVLPRVTLKTGDNLVAHTLGRTPQGWAPMRQIGSTGPDSATVYESQDPDPKFLYIHASVGVTLDILVY